MDIWQRYHTSFRLTVHSGQNPKIHCRHQLPSLAKSKLNLYLVVCTVQISTALQHNTVTQWSTLYYSTDTTNTSPPTYTYFPCYRDLQVSVIRAKHHKDYSGNTTSEMYDIQSVRNKWQNVLQWKPWHFSILLAITLHSWRW